MDKEPVAFCDKCGHTFLEKEKLCHHFEGDTLPALIVAKRSDLMEFRKGNENEG